MVVDGDTIVGITLDHVDSLNIVYVNLDECSEARDSLTSLVATQDDQIEELKEKDEIQEAKIDDLNSIMLQKDVIIDERTQQNIDLKLENTKLRRKNKILGWAFGGTGVVVIGGTIAAILLLK